MATRACHFLDRPQGLAAALAPFSLLNLLLLLVFDDLPWTNADSWEYMGFEPWRTLGYGGVLRLTAMIFPSPVAVIWLQVMLTVAAIHFLAESLRRLTRDGAASWLAGFLLLSSWPAFIYAFHLLADQLFLVMIMVHFAAAARAMEQQGQSPRWLWIMAISAATAVALRPAGHFLFLAVPLLLVLHPAARRRILGHMLLPLMVMVLGLATAHHAVLGYFGLSSFAGLTLSSNMLYLAQPGTPSSDPELMEQFAARGAQYRAELETLPDPHRRFDAVRLAAAPLTNWALVTVAQRIPNGDWGIEARSTATLHQAGALSSLNAVYSDAYGRKRPSHAKAILPVWYEANARLTRAALEVFNHDPLGTLSFTLWKLAWGWREVLPVFSMRNNIGPNEILLIDRPDLDFRRWHGVEHYRTGLPHAVALVHDLCAAPAYVLSPLFPVLVGAAATGAPIWCLLALWRRRPVPIPVVLGTYAGLTLIAYHAEVAFAQVGLARFLTSGMPMVVILLALIAALIRRRSGFPATIPGR